MLDRKQPAPALNGLPALVARGDTEKFLTRSCPVRQCEAEAALLVWPALGPEARYGKNELIRADSMCGSGQHRTEISRGFGGQYGTTEVTNHVDSQPGHSVHCRRSSPATSRIRRPSMVGAGCQAKTGLAALFSPPCPATGSASSDPPSQTTSSSAITHRQGRWQRTPPRGRAGEPDSPCPRCRR